MKKSWIIVVLLIVVGLGGYGWYSTQQARIAKEEAAAVEAAQKAAEEAAAAEAAAQKAAEEAAALKAAEEAAAAEAAAAAAAEAAAAAALEAAAAAAAEAAAAAAAGEELSITDLLSVDTFDADKLAAAIDASDLNDLQKIALKAAVEQAAANPELVQGVIDQIKAAMGL